MNHHVTVCIYAKVSSQGQYTFPSLFNYNLFSISLSFGTLATITLRHLLTLFLCRSFPNPSKADGPG